MGECRSPSVTPSSAFAFRGTPLPVAAVVIGVITHVVWDLFTHEGRFGTQLFPSLGRAWGPLPGYEWLQYGCSALGLAAILAWAVVRLARTPPLPPSVPLAAARHSQPLLLAGLVVVAALAAVIAAALERLGGSGMTSTAVIALTTSIRWVFVAGVVLGVAVRAGRVGGSPEGTRARSGERPDGSSVH